MSAIVVSKPGTKKRVPTLSREAMYTIIRAPLITEKATLLSEKGQIVFRVAIDATKPEIKAAVEMMWKVEVDTVQVSIVKGKEKRFGRFIGKRRGWKKAYVSLKPGQEINFATEP